MKKYTIETGNFMREVEALSFDDAVKLAFAGDLPTEIGALTQVKEHGGETYYQETEEILKRLGIALPIILPFEI